MHVHVVFKGVGFPLLVFTSCLSCLLCPLSLLHIIRAMTAALENEVLRNPKPSLVDRSVLELSPDKLVPPDIYVDRALLRARGPHDSVCEAGGPSRGHKWPRSDSPDSDVDLVAGAKARIQELQKEAETLEEAYRSYQQRAVLSTISHLLPTGAHPLHRPDSPRRRRVSQHPHTTHPTHRETSRTSASAPQDTRTSATPAQLRVTFSEDHKQQQQVTDFTDLSVHSFPSLLRDGRPQDGDISPSRRLSSTPHSSPFSSSSSRKKKHRKLSQGNYYIKAVHSEI